MELSTNDIKMVNLSSNLTELQNFIYLKLKVQYTWINKITDIFLLKTLILNNLFDTINKSLLCLSVHDNFDDISITTIEQLQKDLVYSQEQAEFLRKNKKRSNIKAVSS